MVKIKAKIEELENKWKRALADYDNLRKRVEAEKKELILFANASLIDKLLSVLDSLQTCTAHLKDEGVKLILEQLKRILKSEGVVEIEALGKKFDPELMDAVELVAGEKDKVIEVILPGYRLNAKILRPVKVKIGTDQRRI